MNQIMALVVQVDALGGDVTGEQQPHRLLQPAEAVDDLLLLLVVG